MLIVWLRFVNHLLNYYLLTYLFNTKDDVYSAVIMTTRSLRESSFDECRTVPSGRRPSDQAT